MSLSGVPMHDRHANTLETELLASMCFALDLVICNYQIISSAFGALVCSKGLLDINHLPNSAAPFTFRDPILPTGAEAKQLLTPGTQNVHVSKGTSDPTWGQTSGSVTLYHVQQGNRLYAEKGD